MQAHVHASAPERNAFHLQPKTLVHRGVPAQLDLPAGAENPVPGQGHGGPQGARHQPGAARIARRFRDRSVGGNVPARHFLNRGNDTITHLDFLSDAI